MGDGGQYVMIYLAMMMHVSFVGNLGLRQVSYHYLKHGLTYIIIHTRLFLTV